MTKPADYRGKDLAPYMRFRKTRFYGGCYTADVAYCNWSCSNCWSGFGWRGLPPKMELDSEKVVAKLVEGLERNGLTQARISGGEASIYWKDHFRLVAERFLVATADLRIAPPGQRRKEPVYLVVETNGTAMTPREVGAFERRMGDEAERIQITIGVKATSAERLASLTGHTLATAERFRAQQIKLVRYMVRPERIMPATALFLDRYTDEAELDRFKAMLDRLNPGISEEFIDIQEFKTTGWGDAKYSERRYTPKRKRAKAVMPG